MPPALTRLRTRTGASAEVRRNLRNGLLFASPWLVNLVLFIAYPLAASLYYSLCTYDALRPPRWVGLENYRILFTEDPLFWKALWNTLYIVALGLPLNLAVSLGIALLMNQKLKGMAFYRTVFYLPSITPLVAASILWLWLLNPEMGLVNGLLEKVGIHGPGWLASPEWAKPGLILMGLWGAGGSMVIYLAGLQDIPEQLYEAASLDGAGKLSQFRHVTLPMLSPVILFNLIMGLIAGFQYFTQVWVITSSTGNQTLGSPQDSTLVYALYLFSQAFLDFKMGYACAMAWVLFLVTLVCALVVFRTSARWVYYGGDTNGER